MEVIGNVFIEETVAAPMELDWEVTLEKLKKQTWVYA